jgi:uncharacterized membrane protein YphA (DoxX/SURF4 family)
MSFDPSILIASRVLGALVFGMAVLGKLHHRDEFVGVVANYRLVPEPLVSLVAWLVVALETVVVLSLATGVGLAAGAGLSVILLCGFALAMTINLARGRQEIDCGCFQSALRQRLSVPLIVRNLVLTAAILPLSEAGARSARLVPLLAGEMQSASLLQVLDGVAGGIVLFVLYQVFSQLLALQHAAEATRKRFA